ncbi:flap endonuclease 1 [Chironomus tepperi]|uniref:flap endonuclease 1 n=1 Tax=Chironomus tepperi TaxID=113505 RepID=UPI00391FAF78
MGIQGLAKLIADVAPHAIKETEIKNYFGRKIAIDASMSLYQFLIAVRAEGAQLTDANGETTSHLMGIFYRTIRLLENGIKPVYVFDGKPPDMKSGELVKRAERREEAQKALDKATEAGDQAEMDKMNRRLVKVTKEHNAEAKELLKLMGVPYIDAASEAEAQCSAMVKAGKVFGVATEDMDAITFGATVLLRHMTFSEARKMPVQEIHYEKVLKGLELERDEFIDLCILMGCDYCDTIRGIGPKRAFELIQKYKSIEKIVENLDKKKYEVPENWNYERARELFKEPEITDVETIDLKWTAPDEDGLVKYLCGDKQFNEDRVRSGAQKIFKSLKTATQGRLDSFFKVVTSTTTTTGPAKRKGDDKKNGPNNKKAKAGGGRKPK